MIALVRAVARLVVVMIAIATCLHVAPAAAANIAYMSATGGLSACTALAPCGTFVSAYGAIQSTGGRILCLDPVADQFSFPVVGGTPGTAFDFDCPAGSWTGSSGGPILQFSNSNVTMTFRNMTFTGVGGATSAITANNSDGLTLIFENCVFANLSGAALDLESTLAVNLVIRNSRISSNGSGVLLKPGAGGSITATFDHVAITDNVGGGIKIDTTNGPVTVDITDGVVSKNGGNGINTLGNASGQAIVSIKNSVIAKNGGAGVQANGTNAGVLLQTTLLDQNAVGATSVVNGGNMFTYGNNSIVGSAGSGFNHTGALQ